MENHPFLRGNTMEIHLLQSVGISHLPMLVYQRCKWWQDVGVSEKIVAFPPKSSILIGFSIIFIIHFGGFSPYFWKHPCFFEGLRNWRRHCLQWNCQWRGFRWHCIKCGLCHKATRLPLRSVTTSPSFDPQISAEVGWRCRLFFFGKLWRFMILH